MARALHRIISGGAGVAIARIDNLTLYTSANEIAERHFDQIWITVASDAMRDEWLGVELGRSQDATVVILQPDLDGGPKWNEGPLTNTRDSFNGLNYDRAEFTATFAQWMVERKLTPAELRWLTEMMESTPTGIAVQLAADALLSDYRPELEKLSQQVPSLHVLGKEDAATAKPWLEEIAPKAKVEVLGRHMMFREDSEAFNEIFSDFVDRAKRE